MPDPIGPPPIVVRHSQLASFRQCPLLEKLSWRDGWHHPAKNAQGPRALGTAWHDMLRVHYEALRVCQQESTTPDLELVWDLVMDTVEQYPVEFHETLVWMYEGYVELYGVDDDWTVLETEKTLRVPLFDEDEKPLRIRDPRDDSVRPVLYEWTSDILIRSKTYRGVLNVDTKSTEHPLGKTDIDLSDQFGLYTVAWNRLGVKVRGQCVNQVKTKRLKRPMTLDERNFRGYSIRTKTELRNIELDAVDTIYAMFSERNTRRPYSAPDPRTCSWKCDFKETHLQLRRMTPAQASQKLPAILRSRGFETGATHR